MITDEQKKQASEQYRALAKLGEILQMHANAYIPMLELDQDLAIDGIVCVGGPRSLALLRSMIEFMGEDDSLTNDEIWIYDVIKNADDVWQTLPEVHRPKLK